jgi:hypothetical protein
LQLSAFVSIQAHHFATVMTSAWILASTTPWPKRWAIASAATAVASASFAASRASISFLSGVPWQYAMAGWSQDGARLRAAVSRFQATP